MATKDKASTTAKVSANVFVNVKDRYHPDVLTSEKKLEVLGAKLCHRANQEREKPEAERKAEILSVPEWASFTHRFEYRGTREVDASELAEHGRDLPRELPRP